MANHEKYYFTGLPWLDYDFSDKKQAVSWHIRYMLARTQSMFEYDGLPRTIPARMLELYLQSNGFAGIAAVNGELYAFNGGLGGVPDPYYQPTLLTVANPALKFTANLKIDEDVIIIRNDSLYNGLLPMFSRYASALTENELSMNIATINSRIMSFLTAPDDRSKLAAEKFLEDVKAGKLGAIASNEFLDGIKVYPNGNAANTQAIKNLIEHEQYLKASWYNDLGLNANYNMKRETLTDSENAMNSDALLPLVDDMLRCREEGLEKVNDMFGTDIHVRLASSWEDNRIELELEHEAVAAQAEPEPEPEERTEEDETVE